MIRHSMEYLFLGLDATTRQQAVDWTAQQLQARTREGSITALLPDKIVAYRDANGVNQIEYAAFCEVNEFLSQQDGDQIFSQARNRAASIGATVGASGRQSYVRVTSSDSVTGQVTRRLTTSPAWADDAGSVISFIE